MTTPTRAELDERHRQFGMQRGILREAAASIAVEPPDRVRALVDAAYDFLAAHFLPNALAEQPVRGTSSPHDYVFVERDLTTQEIERHTCRLAELKANYEDAVTESSKGELRAILYDIAVLVDLHFAA